MTITEIKNMSMIERLQSMEVLWDSLLENESEIESPEWHGEILAERKKQIESGRAEFVTLESLKLSHR
ncbi:addiction module protein [Deltaproteobacteria bacterium TL4]